MVFNNNHKKKRVRILLFLHRCHCCCCSYAHTVFSMLSHAIQHLHKTEWNIRKVYNNRLCGAFNRIMVAEWERESDCERVKLCKGKSQNAKHLARDECMCNNKSQINRESLTLTFYLSLSLSVSRSRKATKKKSKWAKEKMQTEITRREGK